MNVGKKLVRTVMIIFGIFAVGLVFFFILSAPYGDGLEKTMEEADVEEGEPVYGPPLDYGDDFLTAFAMGVIGFFAVLLVILVLGRFLGKKDETHND